MKLKTCLNCKIEKNIVEFSQNKTKKDGYNNWCKKCCKQYREENKTKIKIIKRKYRQKHRKQRRKWWKENPWQKTHHDAKQRCNNPKNDSYKYYGGRGIKMLMTVSDFKFLWFRDKAYLLERPSIDRINNNGNYILDNCRFIEFAENIKRTKK